MAISDIRPGVFSEKTGKYDYNHILPMEHRKNGYGLWIEDRILPKGYGDRRIRAHILHSTPVGVNRVGTVEGIISAQEPGVFQVELSHVNDRHRGKSLGLHGYEAVFAHAFHNHNVHTIAGLDHSSAAHSTHAKIASKHGLEYQSKENEEIRSVNSAGDFDDRYSAYQYSLKNELDAELSKMAISSIPKGVQVGDLVDDIYEYSHVLSDQHRKDGYRLQVKSGIRENELISELVREHDDGFTEPVGRVNGFLDGSNIEVFHGKVGSDHRGKGLGLPMYEALYAHAKHYHRVKKVVGGIHSTNASKMHQRLAAKHGFKYKAKPNPEAPDTFYGQQGDYDGAYSPYRYVLKEELDPSIRKVASIAVFNKDGKLLWGKRNDNGKWTLPGGHLESGEDPFEGAVRELREETGLTSKEWGYLGEDTVDDKILVYCFKAVVDDDVTDSSDDPDAEVEQWEWVDCEEEVPEKIASNLHSPKNITLRFLGLQEDSDDSLEKMAIADIAPGMKIGEKDYYGQKSVRYDYSHVLPQELRDSGYGIEVSEQMVAGVQGLRANLYHKNHPGHDPNESIGIVSANIQGPGGGFASWDSGTQNRSVKIGLAEVHKDHRQKNLGQNLYEAVMAHAKHKHGATHVVGGVHSSMAHRAHQKLAAKHGMDYTANRNIVGEKGAAHWGHSSPQAWENAPTGEYDEKYGEYEYAIKDEIPMEKAKDVPTFPKMGIPDNRRETPIVTNQKELYTKKVAQANAVLQMPDFKDTSTADRRKVKASVTKISPGERGATAINPDIRPSYAIGGSLLPKEYDPRGTQIHENFHQMMLRVEKQHGFQGRKIFSYNLYHSLPQVYRTEIDNLQRAVAGNLYDNSPYVYEEKLARLFNYLNNDNIRFNYHVTTGIFGNKPVQRAIDQRLKRAHRILVAAAESAGPHWATTIKPWEAKNAKVKKSEQLEKGLKEQLAAFAGAAMLTGSAMANPPQPSIKGTVQQVSTPKWHPKGLTDDLHHIAQLESSYGKNLFHAPHSKGDYHTAFGAVGLKVVTAHEEYKRQKHLQTMYPGLDDSVAFTKEFKNNPVFYNHVASAHWNRIKNLLGSPEKAAYGWRWGPTAAKKATPEVVMADPYVKNFLKLAAEKAGAAQQKIGTGTVKKSEELEKAGRTNRAKKLEFDHYSPVEGLKELDPKFQGTGHVGAEKNRPERPPRVYLYEADTKPESHVAFGSTKYRAELPHDTKFYDIGEDPLGLLEPQWVEGKYGMMFKPADLSEVEQEIIKRGFHGYRNYAPGIPNAVVYFGKVPVKPAPPVMKSEEDLTKMAQISHDTPEFKQWFDGSHVAHPDGRPMVVYHGTSKDKDFASFNVGMRGAWFTSDPEGASAYATENDSQNTKYIPGEGYVRVNNTPRVFPVHLSIKNPYKMTAADHAAHSAATNYAEYQKQLFNRIKMAGHDGVDFGNGTWVAFNPNQIKSVFNNTPTSHKHISKSEKITQAGFRSSDGAVQGTGPVHDVEQLPADFTVADEGFITESGNFVTREQATADLQADHPVQSEELDLQKALSQYDISEPVASPEERAYVVTARHQGKEVGRLTFSLNPITDPNHRHFGYHKIGKTDVHVLHRKRGINPAMLQVAANFVKKKLKTKGVVSLGEWREEAATHSWLKLMAQNQKVRKHPGIEPDAPDFTLSEKQDTDLKNDPENDVHEFRVRLKEWFRHRKLLGKSALEKGQNGDWKAEGYQIRRAKPSSLTWHAYDRTGQRVGSYDFSAAGDSLYVTNAETHYDHQRKGLATAAYRMAEAATGLKISPETTLQTPAAQKLWTQKDRPFGKNEGSLESLALQHNLMNIGITDSDHEVAFTMAGHDYALTPEFKAARFIANADEASEEAVRDAAVLYDHDLEYAALYAYNLPRNKEMVDLLRQVKQMQGLGKSEFEPSAIPRDVKAVNSSGQKVAEAVQRAYSANMVQSVKLNGKHSKGASVAIDPQTNKKYLIKPGSGKLSPAAGVNEELASQSRREAAFSAFVREFGCGDYFPTAELVTLDEKEVAVMDLLSGKYRSLEQRRREDGWDASKVLEPYRKSGVLYKWAVIDFLLGNTDRHAGNIMVDGDQKVKLIDHGSAFAGDSFDPANDSKSFIPFYLRAWTNEKFPSISAEKRIELMPQPNHQLAESVGHWIGTIDPEKVRAILSEYGISHDAVLNRLKALLDIPEVDRVNAVLHFWAGLLHE